MAGARQRLPDPRAGRAPVRADPRARAPALRRATSACAPTACCCSPRPPTRTRVADLRIFNPDGSEAELSGNGAREAILYLRRRGWTDREQLRRSTPPPGRSARRSPARTPAAWTWAARASARGLPRRPAGRARRASQAAGRTWRFQHVSIGNPQCAIHVDTLEAARGARPRARSGPPIEAHRAASRTARTSPGTRSSMPTEPRAHPRADLRARGGGDAVLGHRRQRRGGRPRPRRRHGRRRRAHRSSRVTVVLDGGELEVEVGADLRDQPDRLGAARVRRAASARSSRKELHETE